MSYWIVEAVWKTAVNKVSPATSIVIEGVMALNKVGAENKALSLLSPTTNHNWHIVSVKEQ